MWSYTNLFTDPPSMPLDLSSCECNVTDSTEQIELSWKPPQKQGVPSHMYYDIDIYLYELGMQYLRTQRVISNVTGVVVHELEPARTYTFKLFAVSVYLSESGEGILAEMRGKPSETLTMSTVPGGELSFKIAINLAFLLVATVYLHIPPLQTYYCHVMG